MKNLFVKREYFILIKRGLKTAEGRIKYPSYRFKEGDIIMFNKRIKAKITKLHEFSSFKEALENIDFKKLIPTARDKNEALKVYEKIYPKWKEKKYGVLIVEFELLDK